MRRRLAGLALIGVLAAAAARLLIHECASGGAMGSRYDACACAGLEWVVSDRTAADGPRRTICFGWVTSRACFQHRDGPPVPCAPPRP